MRAALFLLLIFATAVPLRAQDRASVREGARLYREGRYAEAAEAFKKVSPAQGWGAAAAYNLGAALYSSGQYEASRTATEAALKAAPTSQAKADAHYNVGNAFAAEKKWAEAVSAYKASLRADPTDRAARYNLSYALAKLKQQQNQQQQQQQQKDQENEKNQRQEQQQQSQQQQNNERKKEEQEQQYSSPVPRQQAEAMLNALRQKEGQVRDRMQKASAMPVNTDKDW